MVFLEASTTRIRTEWVEPVWQYQLHRQPECEYLESFTSSLGPVFQNPLNEALKFHPSGLQHTIPGQFEPTFISKIFHLLRCKGRWQRPLPPSPGIVSHPTFFKVSLFSNVSSFLLNPLKLLISMTDAGNIFHMLASLLLVSSFSLYLSLMEAYTRLLLLPLESWEMPSVLQQN